MKRPRKHVAPFLPQGVDEHGNLVSTRSSVKLPPGGPHGNHTVIYLTDEPDGSHRVRCSCGEEGTLRESTGAA